MTPTEAIEALDGMDRQMIHAKRRIFREIANVIRGLVKITPPPEGMELMRVDTLDRKPVACYRETKSSNDDSTTASR